MVATAATQGVYSKVNIRKLSAERAENVPESAAPRSAVLVFISTAIVLTTASLAEKPEISEVVTLQSAKPSGLNMGETD